MNLHGQEKHERSEAEKGSAARDNVYSAFPSKTESIKGKLTQQSDVVEETRTVRDMGGTGMKGGPEKLVIVNVEETPTESVVSTFKGADQAVGENLNDAMPLDDNGTIRFD